jgi:ribosome maturation factor RimP
LSGQEFIDKIRDLAAEVTAREGCLLYDLEFTGGPHGRVLRVYIDRDAGTVSIDDCANVSRGLNLLLDVEDLIPGGRYELEVSSPGLERRLSKDWHFARAVGQPVRLKTAQPVTGGIEGVSPQTLIDGDLVAANDGKLKVMKDGKEWEIAVSDVAKANVRFIPPDNSLKGKKKR